jgi:hypothetical protein
MRTGTRGRPIQHGLSAKCSFRPTHHAPPSCSRRRPSQLSFSAQLASSHRVALALELGAGSGEPSRTHARTHARTRLRSYRLFPPITAGAFSTSARHEPSTRHASGGAQQTTERTTEHDPPVSRHNPTHVSRLDSRPMTQATPRPERCQQPRITILGTKLGHQAAWPFLFCLCRVRSNCSAGLSMAAVSSAAGFPGPVGAAPGLAALKTFRPLALEAMLWCLDVYLCCMYVCALLAIAWKAAQAVDSCVSISRHGTERTGQHLSWGLRRTSI